MSDPPLDIRDWLQAVVNDETMETTEPLFTQTEREALCIPHHFLLDCKDRTVTCGKCKKEFLPFDALNYLSRDWARYRANLEAIKADIRRLSDVRDQVRKRVSNLKAQAKRAAGAAVNEIAKTAIRKGGAT